jgi:bifunctional UDP-N-acetylglucosamine pyrophosphorylase / glucosamine-1-phosphate N-acetyltransferase
VSEINCAIVLAAGEGKRMRSQRAKVLHEICGAPLVAHVIDAISALDPKKIVTVLGHQREQVKQWLAQNYSAVETVIQEEQLGTGHAVKIALSETELISGKVLIAPADMPLITSQDLAALVRAAEQSQGAVLTANLTEPAGYGRVQSKDGLVQAIIEEKDADNETKKITEVNTGIYIFDVAVLIKALANLKQNNAQKEFYLTDVIAIINSEKGKITKVICSDSENALGVNDRAQLAQAEAVMQKRINEFWLGSGVSMRNPDTVFIDKTADLAADCYLDNNTFILGKSKIESGSHIGPDTSIINSHVKENAKVLKSHLIECEVGESCTVGPFTYLRPGAKLAKDSKVGAYVEVKNSEIGEGSKVPHLSYIGDGKIGRDSNIGAGTIFANYDGENKHATVVGDFVKIGSDNVLVAPVVIGDGAYTAAGSVIVENVEPGAMGVARGKQKNILGWVKRKRPNSKAAQAAERAQNPDSTS